MLYGDEFEPESFGFGPKFRLLPFLVSELISRKAGVVELLPGSNQVKDDPGQLVSRSRDRFRSAKFGAHPPVEITEAALAVVKRLGSHTQSRCGPALHLARADPQNLATADVIVRA